MVMHTPAGSLLERRHRGVRATAWAAAALLLTFVASTLFSATPAGAATVVDGCAIVAHPNATHHTQCPGATLTAADLSHLDLDFADLAGADLSNANLSSSTFRHADLSGAKLSACQETTTPVFSIVCTEANVAGSIFPSADLSTVQAIGVNFATDDLDHADLTSTTLVSCLPPTVATFTCLFASFDHANLTGAKLTNAGTSSCFTIQFGDQLAATCGGVDLSGAELQKANLTGTDLSWVSLASADLRHATFTSATFGECEGSPAVAACNSANLDGADLQRTSLAGLHLNGVDLHGANLTDADLTGTDLTPLVLLPGLAQFPSTLDGANFSSANLTQANLTSASAVGTTFTRVRWSSTICPDGTNSDADGRTCVNDLG
jgi:uncharacterized protein YjbI with pentapeptide repeats